MTSAWNGACGFMEEGDKGELGVAARVDVTPDELERCAAALEGQHGGKIATKNQGRFVTVDVESAGAQGDAPERARIAYGQGGLLVAARGAWFDAMLAAAEGTRPSLWQAEHAGSAPGSGTAAVTHAGLRASMTGRDGWHVPDVLVTALLPRSVRDRIRAEMAGESNEGPGRELMTGVLGVSAVGIALRAGAPGTSTEAAAELVCDTENDCAAVEKLILKKRLDWSKTLMLRMVGLGPLIDSVTVRREPLRVRVTAKAGADALAATIDRVVRFSGDHPADRAPRPRAEPR